LDERAITPTNGWLIGHVWVMAVALDEICVCNELLSEFKPVDVIKEFKELLREFSVV
jgi:hypothetical protein